MSHFLSHNVQKQIPIFCDKLKEILIKKNQNYGCSAFLPPVFSDVSPEKALFVRLSDKVRRLQTLTSGEMDKVGESLDDTLMDTAGYCILILIERTQNGESETQRE